MAKLLYKKINAFTDGSSSGNPAGVVYLNNNQQLPAGMMQEIAKRQQGIVSEVVFCTPLEKGSYLLKYYSSECEVEFCGHATIACMYDLVKNEPALSNIKTILIKTVKGELPVVNDMGGSDSVFITAPVPEYLSCHLLLNDIASHLNISEETIDKNYAVSMVNGGLRTLIVPVQSLSQIINIKPDQLSLGNFCRNKHIDIILVFSVEVTSQTNMFRTRVFAPKYGYLEDPATGSGNAAFGYYLLKYQLWNGGMMRIEQGPDRLHPNVVKLKAESIGGIPRVLFGGNAVVESEKQLDIEDLIR